MTMSAPWARVDLGGCQTNQKAREKGADMLIIDSLLMSTSFLSRRGAENPLSFSGRSSASGNGVDGQVHRTEFGAIVGLIGAEHGKQSMQQYD